MMESSVYPTMAHFSVNIINPKEQEDMGQVNGSILSLKGNG